MSFEEKGTWLYLVIISVLPIAYVAAIAGQATSVPVTDIEYQGPMLAAIIAGFIPTIPVGKIQSI